VHPIHSARTKGVRGSARCTWSSRCCTRLPFVLEVAAKWEQHIYCTVLLVNPVAAYSSFDYFHAACIRL
jgi:hypothetical protein